jgi:pilus assembly protein Flp/PilA
MMKRFMRVLLCLRKDKRGVTVVEYALLAGLIAIALAAGLTTLKGQIGSVFTSVGTAM